MTVLGLDPGLASLGWGAISRTTERGFENGMNCLGYGILSTLSNMRLEERLLKIEREFLFLLRQFRPMTISYEKQFFVRNVSSGLEVAHVLGVILVQCAKWNIPTVAYSPSTIKKNVVGNARAKKTSVERFLCMRLGMEKISSHHASDALGAAFAHLSSIESCLPKGKDSFSKERSIV